MHKTQALSNLLQTSFRSAPLEKLKLNAAVASAQPLKSTYSECKPKRDFSTDRPKDAPSPVYELRNYRYTFTEFKKTLELFEKYVHLRMAHSELVGFWTAEIGESIHEVSHIWKYDSVSHRAKVRQGLLTDETWMKSFMANMVPNVQYMRTALLAPVPGTELNQAVGKDQASVGVYTLEKFAADNEAPLLSGSQSEHLVGRFKGIFGETGIEYRLWRFPDVDAAVAGSWKQVTGASGNISNVLLYPTKWSPLQ